MLVDMNLPISLQPYLNQLSPTYGASTNQAALSSADEGLFSGLLQEQIAAGQQVISAEEIIAELDGSPEWNFTQRSNQNTLNQSADGKSISKGQAALAASAVMEKIDRIARSIGVDNDLVREVVRAESNFNPTVVSRVGAKGLMQLMDPTARAMNVRNPFNPDENLSGGTKYLKKLLDRYDGNVKVALAAYNAGPGRVSRLGIDNDAELEEKYDQLPLETQRYVKKIMSRLDSNRTSW